MKATRERQVLDPEPRRAPTISVVVPTRDRPGSLARAVRSILEQRYEGDVDVVVVFDQSEIMKIEIDHPKAGLVRAIANGRAPGRAGARNSGILAAEGELVAFCDDDDEWFPDKLEVQVKRFLELPEAAAATTGVVVEFEGRSYRRIAPTEFVTFDMLLRSRLMELHPSTFLAWRRDLIDNDGLVDEAIPGGYGEDYEWLLRRARRGPVLAVRQPLARVHWGGSSWFTGRWDIVTEALSYLLERYPEFAGDRQGIARLRGQLAFAHAAARRPAEARRSAWVALRANPFERRAFAALAVSTGLISPKRILHIANRFGRGI
jgi:glycosyltransferase involved in cell wall biosynthesis